MSESDLNNETLKEGAPCPNCGKPLVLRHSNRGDFLGCSDYPTCSFLTPVSISHHVQVLKILEVSCPKCGGALAVKRGRFGFFIGCMNYPSCDFVHSASNEEVKAPCPICKKGQLAARQSKSGHIFYGCTNYPECTYSVPGKPVEQTCTRCSFPLMYEKETKKGTSLMCGNSLCPSRYKRKHKPKERKDD